MTSYKGKTLEFSIFFFLKSRLEPLKGDVPAWNTLAIWSYDQNLSF